MTTPTSKKDRADDATKAGLRHMAQNDLFALAKILLNSTRDDQAAPKLMPSAIVCAAC